VEFHSINLKKKCVNVSFIDWEGEGSIKTVRVKVTVGDVSKIPPNKLSEMEQDFFLIDFDVEEIIEKGGNDEDENDDDENQQLSSPPRAPPPPPLPPVAAPLCPAYHTETSLRPSVQRCL
jgi:hypothetical protein